jgi:hypothetical protein
MPLVRSVVSPLTTPDAPTAIGPDAEPDTSIDWASIPGQVVFICGSGTLGWSGSGKFHEGELVDTVDAPFASGRRLGLPRWPGKVFVCGVTNGHWFVRQRNSNGVWSTIRDWSDQKSYHARKMHFTSGYLFVVGEVCDSRATLDLANTWDALTLGAQHDGWGRGGDLTGHSMAGWRDLGSPRAVRPDEERESGRGPLDNRQDVR